MTPPPASEAEMPSPGIRTLVSFLLFVHLFALGVALASNARPISALRNQLGTVPGIKPYLQLLHMDLAYNYHLTYAEGLDFDHHLEVETDWQGERSAEATVLRFPEPDVRGLRVQHYRNLLLNVAAHAEEEIEDTALPRAIAERLLKEHGITAGGHRIRCVRHMPLRMEEVGSSDPSQRDPYAPGRFQTIYEADARFYQQELVVIRVAPDLQTAPVERSR